MEKKRILVIAGSDSSGGAGLEADQKTIAAHGCYAMTATTALTAQNTQGVRDIHITPPSFVEKQIDACFEDVGVDVVKLGMLASAETVQSVAQALRRHRAGNVVLDPVMVATTGAQLLAQDAVRNLRTDMVPLATILTPNIPEAQLLLRDAGHKAPDIETVDDLKTLAKAVLQLGSEYVLLKGGHVPVARDGKISKVAADRHTVMDVLVSDGQMRVFETTYIDSKNTHGTGCSLASSIASNLAIGLSVPDAVKSACRYVEAGIKTSQNLGQGSGPINHFHSTYNLPFAPGRFIEYIVEHSKVKAAWQQFTEHAFVAGLADGSLPLEAFKFYLIQDYLYLVQFARANALASYKASNMEDISMSAKIVNHIHEEMKLHLDYCSEFGLSREDVESQEESQACTAYSRYMLDVGQSQDWLALQVALAPCLLGYGAIARRLVDDPKTKRDGNTYWKWISNYVEDDYTEAVRKGSELLEKYAVKQSPSRIEELVQIFVHATKMETGFWDMGATAGQ